MGLGKPMSEGEWLLVLPAGQRPTFRFVALRFPDIGVLGPFGLDTILTPQNSAALK